MYYVSIKISRVRGTTLPKLNVSENMTLRRMNLKCKVRGEFRRQHNEATS
jgi:hypothetical protein